MQVESSVSSTGRGTQVHLAYVALAFGAVAALVAPFVAQDSQRVNASASQTSAASNSGVGQGDSSKSAKQRGNVAGNPADVSNFVQNATGDQYSYLKLSNHTRFGSATERFPRPALSLIKLYIADYVLKNGDEDQKDLALEMIRSSDDEAAEELYAYFPESIDETASEYGLISTQSDERWGYSVTSTYDIVKFIEAKLREDPHSPILEAMKESHEFASDGYAQNFGTSTLPGVNGTKWGWGNDYDLHSSVSFGDDFVVAAAVTGTADDLTELTQEKLLPLVTKK